MPSTYGAERPIYTHCRSQVVWVSGGRPVLGLRGHRQPLERTAVHQGRDPLSALFESSNLSAVRMFFRSQRKWCAYNMNVRLLLANAERFWNFHIGSSTAEKRPGGGRPVYPCRLLERQYRKQPLNSWTSKGIRRRTGSLFYGLLDFCLADSVAVSPRPLRPIHLEKLTDRPGSPSNSIRLASSSTLKLLIPIQAEVIARSWAVTSRST